MGTLICLPSLKEPGTSQALVPYEPEDAQECDGARTLRLVERAVDSMQALRVHADHISAQSLDLIRLTQRERFRMQAELRRAREAAVSFQQQARDAQGALEEAVLRIREADLGRREAELMAHQARDRADAAETRLRSLEFYLKKISNFLQLRLVSSDR
ncbi:hypothetical protein [Methylobacterium trifolii]|nr:hypothetical protein [Methylobacterium trifolii]